MVFLELTLSSRRTGTHWLMIRAGVFELTLSSTRYMEGIMERLFPELDSEAMMVTWGRRHLKLDHTFLAI